MSFHLHGRPDFFLEEHKRDTVWRLEFLFQFFFSSFSEYKRHFWSFYKRWPAIQNLCLKATYFFLLSLQQVPIPCLFVTGMIWKEIMSNIIRFVNLTMVDIISQLGHNLKLFNSWFSIIQVTFQITHSTLNYFKTSVCCWAEGCVRCPVESFELCLLLVVMHLPLSLSHYSYKWFWALFTAYWKVAELLKASTLLR